MTERPIIFGADSVRAILAGRSGCFHRSFAGAWDSLNGKRGHGWVTNPWVWAVTFEVPA